MTIKQLGGVFGRNPTFNNVTIEGTLTFDGDIDINSDLTISGNLYLPDNSKAIFGDGSDLQIYHDGSNSYIDDAGTGNLLIRGSGITRIQSYLGEDMIVAVTNGAANLYYDSAKKLATTATGIDVTGVITTDGMTTSADVNFGDNSKAIFGDGSDLQIYHNGSGGYIDDQGTGPIRIRSGVGGALRFQDLDGDDLIYATSNGAVTLYYDNSAKLATTATGIDVTGSVTADGLTVETTTPSVILSETDRTDENTQLLNASGDFRIRTRSDDGGINTDRLRIDHGTGDISFYSSDGLSQALFWDASASALGLGTTTPDTNLHIVASAVAEMRYGAIGPSNNSALRISRNDSTTASGNPLGYLEFGGNDATGAVDTSFAYVGAEASGTHAAGDNPTDLVFGTTADGSATVTERMRIDASGHAIIPAGVTLGTAAGVYNAAKTLDDYEEGTWTATIADAQTGGNTGSTHTGRYRKVGTLVTVFCALTNIDTTGLTATNVMYVQGLPFTSNANNFTQGTAKIDQVSLTTGRTYIYSQVSGNDTWLNFQTAGDSIGENNVDAQHITSGVSDIQFTIQYIT